LIWVTARTSLGTADLEYALVGNFGAGSSFATAFPLLGYAPRSSAAQQWIERTANTMKKDR